MQTGSPGRTRTYNLSVNSCRPVLLLAAAPVRQVLSLRFCRALGVVDALDAATGKMKWEFRLHSPLWAGVMATAGGLVFGGSNEGNLYALDARTGKQLWEMQTGGEIVANPVGFSIDGKEHVAIAAGQTLIVFGL